MKTSVNGSIDRIRFLLGDVNPNNRLVSFDTLKRLLDDQAAAFASEIPVNRQTQSISLTANDYQKALTSTATQYRVINHVLDDEGRPLPQVSLDYLLTARRNAATGRPRMFAIEENGSGVVTLDFYPTPGSAYTFTVYYQEFPLMLQSDGTEISEGATIQEGTTTVGSAWPFDEPTVRALEKAVAIRVLMMTPNEELLKRGMSKDIVQLWTRDVEVAKSQARIRIARQRRTSAVEMWG